jgi:hypothetical protein
MLLIDTRGGRPEPEAHGGDRVPWEPNWRLCGWLALTIAAGVTADATAGLVAYVCGLAMVCFACRAICVVLPPLDGLRDYRQ